MTIINVKELRKRLKYYLDELERGEELTIIRNSQIIGRLILEDSIDETGKKTNNVYEMSDKESVIFRRFGQYEDPEPIQELHREALEAAGAFTENSELDMDLHTPSDYYEKQDGEFWVGEINKQIVAMGAFKMDISSPPGIKRADMKRMRVKPTFQGRGIGRQMLIMLEERAKNCGYVAMSLDVTNAPGQAAARQLYESAGYKEHDRQMTEQSGIIYYAKAL